MNLNFSKMSKDDVGGVFELESELIGSCSLENIAKTIDNENLNYYVLKNENEIVAFMEISIISPDCELFDIAVKKEFQGKGYAKFLMEKLIKIAKENLCATIFLEVNSINYKAINLYKSYGFYSYSIRKNYYGKNDAILMKLDLNV